MDTSVFLSSLPFLIPLQSQAWPPIPIQPHNYGEAAGEAAHTTSTIQRTSTSSCTSVLLDETDKYNRSFFLSIEATFNNGSNDSNPAATSLGTSKPAFFVLSNKPGQPHGEEECTETKGGFFDIGMNLIQIALEERHVVRAPPYTINEQTKMQTPLRQQRASNQNHYLSYSTPNIKMESATSSGVYSIVYIKVLDHIYAIDMSKLREVELLPEYYLPSPTENDDNKNNNYAANDMDDYHFSMSAAKAVSKPPSLLLHFDCAVFRIFSFRKPTIYGNTASSNFCTVNDINEEKETLRYIQDRFVEILKLHQGATCSRSNNACWSLMESDVISPSRSSVTGGSSSSSTLPAGQYENEIMRASLLHEKEDDETHSMNTLVNPTDANQEDLSISLPQARFKRRKLNYHLLHENLKTLQMILETPQPSIAISSTNNATHQLFSSSGGLLRSVLSEHNLCLGPLLNLTCDLQKLSYINTNDLNHIINQNQLLLQANEMEMEKSLNVFFPTAPHRGYSVHGHNMSGSTRKANKSSSTSFLTADSAVWDASNINDDDDRNNIEIIEKRMVKHKKLSAERYKLFLMSTRG